MKFGTLLLVMVSLLISTVTARADWENVTVARQADIGTGKMSMARDANNTLYIAYLDVDETNLKYADNSGGTWKTAVIARSSGDASIAVDSNSKAHITHHSGSTLKYATNVSGTWVDTSIASSSYMSDIAVDSNYKVHISYFRWSDFSLVYATNASGSWVFTTVDDTLDSDSGYTSIGLDSSENVHISYSFGNEYDSETHYELKYATNSSGSWAEYTINSSGHIGRDTTLAIDSSDYVHIASFETEARSLQYTTNASGSWVTQTADPGVGVSLGYRPSIGVDSSGDAHISYYKSAYPVQRVMYATNSSGAWTNQDLEPSGGLNNIGNYSSLVVDTDDYIHIVYDYNHQWLKYIRNTSGSFDLSDTYVIDGTEDPMGTWSSLALDTSGYPHISYLATYHLRYAHVDQGVWFNDQVAQGGNVGKYSSLVLDDAESPDIACYESVDNELIYASFSTGTWVFTTLDGSMDGGISMARDSNDKRHIVYKKNEHYLYYATDTSGSWVVGNVNMSIDNYYGRSNSIAVDPGDKEHIAWYYNNPLTNTEYLNYATNTSGSWASFKIDTDSGFGNRYCYSSIAVDSYYYSHISYYDADGGNLKYATNATGSWVVQTLESAGDTGLYTSIVVDPSDYIHISYYYSTDGYLKYISNLTGSWVSETVDSSGSVGTYTSLALNSAGLANISYYDATNGTLKFAYQTVPSPTTSPTPFGYKTPSSTPTLAPTSSPTATPSHTPTNGGTPMPTGTQGTPLTPVPTPTPSAQAPPWIYDYNGDGTSDIAIFRPGLGLWAVRGITRVYFGGSTDETVPGDYDGDGTTDIGIFRISSGLWAIKGVTRAYFGGGNDLPEPGDYDGNGTADIGIYRPTSGLWAIKGVTRAYFGGTSDSPVPGFYEGSARKDIGIFRGGSGLWAIRDLTRIYFGSSVDISVPGDYNGDLTWEAGIFRSSSGLWAIRGVTRAYFGGSIDDPRPADYSGSGRDDIGIFRSTSGLWAVKGVTRVYFGGASDIPVVR